MDPELKKMIEELRGTVGKNVEALARVEQIEQAAKTRDADLKLLREELEKVKAAHAERETLIRELQQNSRVRRAAADPLHDRNESQAMLGMIVRQELARMQRVEIPAAFREEDGLVRSYREQLLARATLTPGAASGSYLVPAITEAMLIDAIEEVSDLLSRVDFVPNLPAASTISIPTLTTRPTLQPARASTDTKKTQSDPAFGQLQLAPQEAYIYFPVDNRLIQMSALPLGGLLMNVLRDGIIQGVCTWLLSGDGTDTYNDITGILNQSTDAYVYSLGAGKTGFANLTKSDLTSIKARALKRGRARGVWLMSLEVQGIIEDLDRQGKTPVITYAQDGTARCLQNPIVNDEGMPDLADSAAAKAFLGFGDLATFMVGMVGGIQLASSTDYLFGNNQTAFRGTLNMDIQRKPVATFITGKTAAQ